jgi:hypothetical protein
MKYIQKSAENMGGVIRLWAIPPSDYSLQATSMVIATDENMVAIYTQEDSVTFTENPIEGAAFKTEITGTVPCDSADTLKLIAQMERTLRYNVVFQDGNGNYKVAGTRNVPLRFSARLTTGGGAASLNHYSIAFTANVIKERAVFISDPFQ